MRCWALLPCFLGACGALIGPLSGCGPYDFVGVTLECAAPTLDQAWPEGTDAWPGGPTFAVLGCLQGETPTLDLPVPGATQRWGATLLFQPDEPFAAETTAVVRAAQHELTWSFAPAEGGGPGVAGAFALRTDNARVLLPPMPGTGAVAALRPVVELVADPQGSAVPLRVGSWVGAPQDGTSGDSDPIGLDGRWAEPWLDIGPMDLGDLLQARLRGRLGPSPTFALTAELPTDDGACAEAEELGTSCRPCSSGDRSCLPLVVVDILAEPWPSTLGG